jgi:CDP-diglyceride synthetase
MPRNDTKANNADDVLLDSEINKHKVEKKTQTYLAIGFVLASLPTILYAKVHGLEATSPITLIILAGIVGAVTYSLIETYHKTFEARVTKLKSEFPEHSSKQKESKRVALIQKAALAYTAFFNNAVFLVLVLFLHFYVLKNAERHIAYILGMVIPAGVIYWLANANEKTINKRRTTRK